MTPLDAAPQPPLADTRAAVRLARGNELSPKARLIARILLTLSILAIATLSLVPGSLRPHTGFPGQWEHFAAYFGAGALLSFAYASARPRLLGCAGLAAISGLFEVLQHFSPGRSPCVCDAVASSAGAAFGTIAGVVLCAVVAARFGATPPSAIKL